MALRFENKVAVVTGSGRGIGAATIRRLASEGAAVVINDLDPEPAEALAKQIREQGGRAAVAIASVAEPAGAEAIIGTAEREFGRLDILVCNAGITRDSVIHRMTDEQWHTILDVHLGGAFNCIRAASHLMRDAARQEQNQGIRQHRKIVVVSSMAGTRGNFGQANYSAAKAGQIGLAKAMAKEWAPFLINVNVLAPGFVDTRLTTEKQPGEALGIPKDQRDAFLQALPFGRPARPEEMAGIITFLCSPDADFVTGHVIEASGGASF